MNRCLKRPLSQRYCEIEEAAAGAVARECARSRPIQTGFKFQFKKYIEIGDLFLELEDLLVLLTEFLL